MDSNFKKMSYKNYCFVFIVLTLAIVQAVGYETELYETESCDSTACFKALHGALGDCNCNVDTIDYFNNVKIFPRIQSLVSKDYFRFYKVNLKKECPFWVDDSRCAMKYCHVKACPKDSVPRYFGDDENNDMTPATKYSEETQSDCNSDQDYDHNLGYLNMTISAASQFEIAKWSAYDSALENFCECDDRDADAEYVDLSLNPERYTGYKGTSAHRIWRSIYQENCFRPKLNPYEHFPYVLSSDLSNMCLEKRVFYRAVSGMHTSINIHLCAKYLLPDKGFASSPEGEWGPNLAEFQRRFDPAQTLNEGPNWLKNLYFVYLLEMRALAKAGPYLEKEEFFTGNHVEDEETRGAISNMLGVIYTFPDHFNESSMFNGGAQATLKREFREHFLNITRIMDCVGCDKCKLWGKLQIQGLGTALKILFSSQWEVPNADPPQGRLPLRHREHKRLQRTEIVALFNAFARLSNSIRELENFRNMLR